jgi:hypothetical protein
LPFFFLHFAVHLCTGTGLICWSAFHATDYLNLVLNLTQAVSAKFPRSIWFVLEGLDTERNLQDLTFVLKHMLKRKIALHGKVKYVPIMLSKVPGKPVIAS